MLLAHVAATSRQIAATSKRLAKIKLLADLLKQLTPAEIEIVVPFLSGFSTPGTHRRRLRRSPRCANGPCAGAHA